MKKDMISLQEAARLLIIELGMSEKQAEEIIFSAMKAGVHATGINPKTGKREKIKL